MARDHGRTQRFIDHNLSVLDIYSRLRALYTNDLKNGGVLTKSDIHPNGVYPKPRPDIYLHFKKGGQELDFMVEYFEADMPWFVIKQTITKYMDHVENGDWDDTDTPYPPVLLVSQSEQTQKRLIKHITQSLEQIWLEELHFALTTLDKLNNASSKTDKIWLPINDEVGKPTALGGLWVKQSEE
ncbi:MAG: hypothetical protein ACREGG_00980 [Candidatus Saccharimonadales bacterium]